MENHYKILSRGVTVPVSSIDSTQFSPTFILQISSLQNRDFSHTINSIHRTSRRDIYCPPLFHEYNTEFLQDHSRLGNIVLPHQISVVIEMWAPGVDKSMFKLTMHSSTIKLHGLFGLPRALQT